MKPATWLGGLILASMVVHTVLQQTLVSFLPITLLLPLYLTWLSPRPVPLLIGWALVAELFSTLPFGILILVTFMPFLLQRIYERISIDLSFSFLALLGATVLVQTVMMWLPDMTQYGTTQVPWILVTGVVAATTGVSFSVCLWFQQRFLI